ncbi:MAG: hypothetical protein WCA32_16355 [Chromatiaceae bacterium]
MVKHDFLDGGRVRKAHSVRQIPPVVQSLATGLARIPDLRYIKIFPNRIGASNVLSADGKKNPVVVIGAAGIVGVELLVDVPHKIVQFCALTSATKGCGRQMVEAVVGATPEDWFLAVLMDWSGGFWNRMAQEYPRLSVC